MKQGRVAAAAGNVEAERRVAAIVVAGLLTAGAGLWWVDRGLSCSEWQGRHLDAQRSMWDVGTQEYDGVEDVYARAAQLGSTRPEGCADPPSIDPWDVKSEPGWWLWEPERVRAYEEANPPTGEGQY